MLIPSHVSIADCFAFMEETRLILKSKTKPSIATNNSPGIAQTQNFNISVTCSHAKYYIPKNVMLQTVLSSITQTHNFSITVNCSSLSMETALQVQHLIRAEATLLMTRSTVRPHLHNLTTATI